MRLVSCLLLRGRMELSLRIAACCPEELLMSLRAAKASFLSPT